VGRRQDLRADRTRAVNRLHDRLVAVCPALERVLDLGDRGALVLLTGFQTPRRCGRRGVAGLEAWLGSRKVRGAGKLAAAAVDAANAQTIRLPGEQVAACLIADLAEGCLPWTSRSSRSTSSSRAGFTAILPPR
jgi:hypothetical protein